MSERLSGFKPAPASADCAYVTSAGARCPSCNAHVTAGSDWCTLCYTDLRPAPEPEPSFAVQAASRKEPLAGAYDDSPPASPRNASQRSGLPLTAEEHQQEAVKAADLMLAQLAADSDVPLKAFAGNFASNGAKVALIAGGVTIVVIVLFGLMALIGTLLPAR